MNAWFDSFVFGAANSLHCAFMCGPLALAFHGGTSGACSYHAARTVAYGLLGVVLGTIGSALGADGLGTPSAWVAFVLSAGIVVLALAGERGAFAIPGIGRALQSATRRLHALPPVTRGALLGLMTPLLPCGLLWAACGGAAIAGSPLAGGAVMAGFAVGTVPLLLFAQTQAGRLLHRLQPRTLSFVRKGAMLSAAALLVWRGCTSLQGGSCCH